MMNEIYVHGVYEELKELGGHKINLLARNERMVIIGDNEIYSGVAYAVIFCHEESNRITGRFPIPLVNKIQISSEFYKLDYGEGGVYKPEVTKEYYTELSTMPKILNRFIKIFSGQFQVFYKMIPSVIKSMNTMAATFEVERNCTFLDYRIVTSTETRALYTACILDLVDIGKRDYINAKRKIKEQQEARKNKTDRIESKVINDSQTIDTIAIRLTATEKEVLGEEFTGLLIQSAIDSFLDKKDFEGLKKFRNGEKENA